MEDSSAMAADSPREPSDAAADEASTGLPEPSPAKSDFRGFSGAWQLQAVCLPPNIPAILPRKNRVLHSKCEEESHWENPRGKADIPPIKYTTKRPANKHPLFPYSCIATNNRGNSLVSKSPPAPCIPPSPRFPAVLAAFHRGRDNSRNRPVSCHCSDHVTQK